MSFNNRRTARIQRFQLAPSRRRIAFSDVHGSLDYLLLLERALELKPSDVLFPVGDYLERCMDSLGTLREIIRLCDIYESYPVLGNCDNYVLWMLSDDPDAEVWFGRCLGIIDSDLAPTWGTRFLHNVCDEIGLRPDAGTDLHAFRAAVNEYCARELSWLRNLPTIAADEHFLFVHGGVPHEDLDMLAETDAYGLMKRDGFMDEGSVFSRWVVCGHWPVTLYHADHPNAAPYINTRQHIIGLDGGCGIKLDGQLNALVIEGDSFRSVMVDRFPEYTALEDQKASDTSVNIRWGDHRVRLLERVRDCAYVEHLSSGRRLWIPAEFLLRKNEGSVWEIKDATDYRLPVNAGERLKLIRATTRGMLMKKNGVSGWYEGKLAGVESI